MCEINCTGIEFQPMRIILLINTLKESSGRFLSFDPICGA